MSKLKKRIRFALSDRGFLQLLELVEVFVAKILTLLMIVVILALVWDVAHTVFWTIFNEIREFGKQGYLQTTLFDVFGAFLTVLIALEIVENITGYLKRHEFQLELVLVTSLVAVSRKIIIFDMKSPDASQDLIGLAVAVISLTVSYCLVRFTARR